MFGSCDQDQDFQTLTDYKYIDSDAHVIDPKNISTHVDDVVTSAFGYLGNYDTHMRGDICDDHDDNDNDKYVHGCIYGTRVKDMGDYFSLEPLVYMCAARTKPAAKPKTKRAGAKATKKIERLVSKGRELDPEEATAYRALAARAKTWPRTGQTSLLPPKSSVGNSPCLTKIALPN